MSYAAEIIRAHWLAGLNSVEKTGKQRMSDFALSDRTVAFFSPVQENRFEISYGDEETIKKVLAFEYSRYSVAALQTVSLLSRDGHTFDKFNFSWRLVEAYYASFYAAHSLLRLCGKTVTFMPSPVVKQLERIADGYSQLNGERISKGTYFSIVDLTSKTILFSKVDINAGGHQVFWKIFKKWLVEIREFAEQSSNSHTYFKNYIAASKVFETTLGKDGDWSSSQRNIVNYHVPEREWFPFSGSLRSSILRNDFSEN